MKILALVISLMISVQAAAIDVVTFDAATLKRAGIEIRQVSVQQFGSTIRVVGQVVRAPGSTATVQSVLRGRVEQLFVAPGDRVAAGSAMLSLHSHELLAMQGDLLRASERARIAANQVVAGRRLLELEGISEIELQMRQQEALVAQLELEAALAELSDVGLHDDDIEGLLEGRGTDAHLLITSPVNGVVLDLQVQEHEWVQAFQPLLEVGDPRRVELELQIAPENAQSVAAGDLVSFNPVGRSGGGFEARVISQVPEVDPTTRTIRLRAQIKGDASSLYPGVFVEGNLHHGGERTAAAIPESAVIRFGADDVVFVQTAEGVFEVRPVIFGQFVGGVYELVGGVDPGEKIAVEGVFFLKSALVKGDGEED